METILLIIAGLFVAALAIRIIRWILVSIYRSAPFVAIWLCILLSFYFIGYFQPIEKEVKGIYGGIIKTIED